MPRKEGRREGEEVMSRRKALVVVAVVMLLAAVILVALYLWDTRFAGIHVGHSAPRELLVVAQAESDIVA
jgi:hypothetical protein